MMDESEKKDKENMDYALQLIASLGLPMVIRTALKLNIFDIIASNGKMSATEITTYLSTQNNQAEAIIERMLRLLVSYSILACSMVAHGEGIDQKVYGLTSVGMYFAKQEDGFSLGPFTLLLVDEVVTQSWFKMEDAVFSGEVPFDKAHGMNVFEYSATDPRFNQVFNDAMFNHTMMSMESTLKSYKGFRNVKCLVDVGGGIGQTLKVIIAHYPGLKGINFDLPHVIAHAVSHPDIQHVGGDMFTSIPTGDAIFMKISYYDTTVWILHCWDDERCITILKNCYNTLPEDGKVIVCEALVIEEAVTTYAAKATNLLDMIMLSQTPGGKERTEREFLTLAIASGFSGIKLAGCGFNFWVIEFYK
ncbi:Cathecol O-methyltransferase 1-like protein [Drosera capensis]